MNTNNQPDDATETKDVRVKIFGVGNTGVLVSELLMKRGLTGASFIAVNNDKKSLSASTAPEKVQFAPRATSDDGRRSRMEAEEHFTRFKELCEGAEVVFIAAGLGGSAGTSISPVVARAAKESGALALAFVTLPFEWEGNRRHQQAMRGLDQLKSAADGVVCLTNQKVAKCVDEKTSVLDTFKITNDLLAEGMLGMWRLVAHKGLIEIQLADLCEMLREQMGESCFACTESSGPMRSKEVLEKLFAHPLLDGGQALTESSAVLVSLLGGPDLTMAEVNRVMEKISRQCERAQVLMGAAIDERYQDRLALTIVTGRRATTSTPRHMTSQEVSHTASHQPQENLDAQLLRGETTARPASRFAAPAPTMSNEKMEQMRQNGSRARKAASRLRQTQLPLEIVSKGRFDKSEPTIHKGEDLDVPTYIRRGIALN